MDNLLTNQEEELKPQTKKLKNNAANKKQKGNNSNSRGKNSNEWNKLWIQVLMHIKKSASWEGTVISIYAAKQMCLCLLEITIVTVWKTYKKKV
jgi:hypothetical protein